MKSGIVFQFENETRSLTSCLFQLDLIHEGHRYFVAMIYQEVIDTLQSMHLNSSVLCEACHEFDSNSTKIPQRWLAGVHTLCLCDGRQ